MVFPALVATDGQLHSVCVGGALTQESTSPAGGVALVTRVLMLRADGRAAWGP